MSNLKIAVEVYRYLKNREFPDKASLKLVGDRYRLSRLERNCLFRGVVPASESESRRTKLVRPDHVIGQALGIDWYNVLITVESYLKGMPVFLSDDGVLRDATGVHGSYRSGEITERAIPTVLDSITALEPKRVDVYLDAPVAFSGNTAAELRERVADRSNWDVMVCPSPDYVLKSYRGIVASSDSIIIDRSERILDLPRFVLEGCYSFEAPDLLSLEIS
jgi:hypothetical protein